MSRLALYCTNLLTSRSVPPRANSHESYSTWLQVFTKQDSLMSVGNLLDLAAALEAGIVPADMVNVGFVRTLYEVEKTVFGEGAELVAQLLVCSAFVGSKTGLGLDNPPANSERLTTAMNLLAAWVRRVSPVAHAEPYVETQESAAYLALDKPLRERYVLGAHLKEEGVITTVAVMLGSSERLKRNAFAKDTPNKTVAVDWSAMVKRHGLGTFVESVVNVLYYKAGATSLHQLLAACFGVRYAGTPLTLRTVKGGQAGYGGIVTFPVYGSANWASYTLQNVLATVADADQTTVENLRVLGQPTVFAVDKISTALGENEHQYTIDLGDGVITDAQINKTVIAAHSAADNAAVDGDEGKKAKVVGVHLHLETASGQMSKLHIVSRGELGLKARTSIAFDGKGFAMYEVVPEPTSLTAYCYVQDLGTDQIAKDGLRDVLCKLAGVSNTTAVAGDHKSRNKTVVEGGTVLFADTYFEARLKAQLEEAPGVDKRLGGYVTLSRADATHLRVVADDVKAVVAFSPTALRHVLDKLGLPYTELRSGGASGGSGAGSVEMSALRQQVELISQQAVEQAAEQAANFSAFAAERAAEAEQAKADAARLTATVAAEQQQVQGLQYDLQRVYGELKCSQESAALAAELSAQKLHAQSEAMMKQLKEVQQQSMQATVLMSAIFKAAPDLAVAVRDQATIEFGGQASGGEASSSSGGEAVDVDMLVEQLAPGGGGGDAARADDESNDSRVMISVVEEELAAANARLALAQQHNASLDTRGMLAPLAGEAVGGGKMVGHWDVGRVGDGCFEGGTVHGYYSIGLVVHRQQLSDAEVDGAHEAEGRGWRDRPMPDMVWVVIAVFTYFRRMHRLLGRCFASVHKARRKRHGADAVTIRQLATASAGCGERAGNGVVQWAGAAIAVMALCGWFFGGATAANSNISHEAVGWVSIRCPRVSFSGENWGGTFGAYGGQKTNAGLFYNNGPFFLPVSVCNKRNLQTVADFDMFVTNLTNMTVVGLQQCLQQSKRGEFAEIVTQPATAGIWVDADAFRCRRADDLGWTAWSGEVRDARRQRLGGKWEAAVNGSWRHDEANRGGRTLPGSATRGGPITGVRFAAALAQGIPGGWNAWRQRAVGAEHRCGGHTGRAQGGGSTCGGNTYAKRGWRWVCWDSDAPDEVAEVSGEKRTSGGAKGNTGPEAKDNWGARVNSWPHVGRLRWTRATEVGNPHETGYELPAHQLMRLGWRPEGWKMGCLRSWLCYVILTIAARTARTYRYRTRRCWGRKEWRYTGYTDAGSHWAAWCLGRMVARQVPERVVRETRQRHATGWTIRYSAAALARSGDG